MADDKDSSMSQMDDKEPAMMEVPNSPEQPRRKKPLWRRIVRWVSGIALGFLLLLVVVATLAVWILTPERLTPLIEKYASEYLIADVHVARAELTFWHTLPELRVDVDTLQVVSRSLDSLDQRQRSQLPEYADSLLNLRGFHGGINIVKLLVGKIAIYDVEIVHPEVNLVAYNGEIANYNIVPESKEEKDTTRGEIPEISIRKFAIIDGAPIRYFSLADSLDVGMYITNVSLDEGSPAYHVDFKGDASLSMLQPLLTLENLPLIANGNITWNCENARHLDLDDFSVGAGPLVTNFDTSLDFNDNITIESLNGTIDRTRLVDVVNLAPAEYRRYFEGLVTNLAVGVRYQLTKAYRLGVDQWPDCDVTVEVPECYAQYDGMKVEKLALLATASIDGAAPDRSVVTLKRFMAIGEGMGFDLDGTATALLTDPEVEGTFKGRVSFPRLPHKLLAKIPATVKGELQGKFDFHFRQSYLCINGLHRILLDGEATLTGLDVTQSELGARLYSPRMVMHLGSNESFIHNEYRSDSLLTASLRVDSLYLNVPGMLLTTSDMLAGVGTRNCATTTNKHIINPIGAVLKMGRVNFESVTDSMKVSLRDVGAHASITRYEDRARVPLVSFNLDAGRMRYRDPLNRVSFRETNLTASFHPRLKPVMSERMSARYDSIAALHPGLRPDSIYALTRASMRQGRGERGARSGQRAGGDGSERVDYGLDRDTRNLLRQISFDGRLTSRSARLFTPYFPVRNRLSNIDLHISSDSLTLRDTRYRMGHSDFLINGTISNLTGALTSRRQTLKIALQMQSDTIDVNEIAEAAFAGAAFAERVNSGEQISIGDTDNDELMQAVIEQTAASDSVAPLLIPMNIDAQLHLRAKRIIYSDMTFTGFRGDVLMYEGQLNLHRLSAAADMGRLSLNALYTAPTADDLSFAFGMEVKDLYIEKFLQLIPAIDSLMPLMQDIKGVINADVAATSKLTRNMDIDIPSLSAAVKITGDSLVLLDAATFRTIAKWMLFKHKERNMVDHMEVQLIVDNSMLEIFPFVFEIDRYRLGIMGSNDLALNLNYHVSVLSSPVPFKFGINIKGNPDKMKIRLGRARFKENMVVDRIALVDTTRINLVNQIENVFRRGVSRARVQRLNLPKPPTGGVAPEESDTISSADSLYFINEGLLPKPPEPVVTEPVTTTKRKKGKK